jgi:Protein of unknown function (DUF1360)
VIPSALVLLVLVLSAYRLTRLIGWDDFPPIHKLRARATGETKHVAGSSNAQAGLTDETPRVTWTWKRPLLAHFLACSFCQGFWTSVVVYAVWAAEPHWSLYALVPLAISGAVGLISKNLDK